MDDQQQGRPQTVQEILEGFTGEAQRTLTQLRGLIRGELITDAATPAQESVRWGQPAYLHASGTILLTFSGHRRHANVVFTPSTLEAFRDLLAGHRTGKGSVQIPYDGVVPEDLLRRMIAHRLREHEEDGVLWR